MRKRILFVEENKTVNRHYQTLSVEEKIFDERWLQELLINNPDLLPIDDLGEGYGELIPLGREVSLQNGTIDNLYATQDGILCIVETKLWRNPEAHRTVVAQVIDYAKDMAKLTFNEFVEAINKSNINGAKIDFWARVSKHLKGIDELDFQAKVQDSLERGRFLLLIVGDRIYPQVAMIIETIQSAPHLEFKMALIELQLFRLSGGTPWPILIFPSVVGKTYEMARAVVKIVYEEKKPEVEVVPVNEDSQRQRTDRILFEKKMNSTFSEVFAPILSRWISDAINIYWGIQGFSVRAMNKGRMRSIIDIYPDSIALYTRDMLEKRDFPTDVYENYRSEIDKVPSAVNIIAQGKRYLRFQDLSVEEFKVIMEATDLLIRSIIGR